MTSLTAHCAKPDVVRSPNVVCTENMVEEFEESNKTKYERFVLDENGKVTCIELVTLSDTNNIFIPTDDKV